MVSRVLALLALAAVLQVGVSIDYSDDAVDAMRVRTVQQRLDRPDPDSTLDAKLVWMYEGCDIGLIGHCGVFAVFEDSKKTFFLARKRTVSTLAIACIYILQCMRSKLDAGTRRLRVRLGGHGRRARGEARRQGLLPE
jgi:hypothetical protein